MSAETQPGSVIENPGKSFHDQWSQAKQTSISQHCKSPNSIAAYEGDIDLFRKYLLARKVEGWDQLTPEMISDFLGYQKSLDLSPSTIRRRLATLRGFFSVLERQEYPSASECSEVLDSIRRQPTIKDHLYRESPPTDNELTLIYAKIILTRDKALFRLLTNGIGPEFVANLKIGDVEGQLYSSTSLLKVTSSYHTHGRIWSAKAIFDQESSQDLKTYLTQERDRDLRNPGAPLITSLYLKDQSITRPGIWLITQGWEKESQIPCNPHRLNKHACLIYAPAA